MVLTVVRKWRTGDATIGELYVNGSFECYTLEDPVREGDIFQVKLPGETAIPAGPYPIELTLSPRFKEVLPLIIDVPNFEGVRIHAGNTAADTAGCILVGKERDADDIRESRAALQALLAKMRTAGGPYSITIEDEWEPSTV